MLAAGHRIVLTCFRFMLATGHSFRALMFHPMAAGRCIFRFADRRLVLRRGLLNCRLCPSCKRKNEK